jgi:hypothetical protein
MIFLFSCAESFSTPESELRTMVGYYLELDRMEHQERSTTGHYGSLEEIMRDCQTSGRYRVIGKCERGYCFEVRPEPDGYALRIIPDRALDDVHRPWGSIYVDKQGAIHFAYGRPYADEGSPVLSPDKLRAVGLQK